MADASERAQTTLSDRRAGARGREYLADRGFTVADIMIGFTLIAARVLGVLDGRHTNLIASLARLGARPVFRRAAAD